MLCPRRRVPGNAPGEDTEPASEPPSVDSDGSKPAKAPLGNGDVSGVPDPTSEAPLGALAEGEGPVDPCRVGGAERSASSSGRSACEPWREVILLKLGVGLSAQRIYQDLTTEHGYAGSYKANAILDRLNAFIARPNAPKHVASPSLR